MSYDTSILIDTGGEHPGVVDDCGNMTSNIGAMYRAVMPGPYEGGGRYDGRGPSEPRGGLTGLSGLPCNVAVRHITEGLKKMIEREEELRKLEPDNGWGSYQGAREYLMEILTACRRNPLGTLAVNW